MNVTGLEEIARQLAFALKGLYEDQVDYLKLNNLGGMDNHWMRAARIALSDYANTSGVHPAGCNCAIKSRDVSHHATNCPYRALREFLADLGPTPIGEVK